MSCKNASISNGGAQSTFHVTTKIKIKQKMAKERKEGKVGKLTKLKLDAMSLIVSSVAITSN